MKKILLVLFIVCGVVSLQAQEINWMSFDDAIAAQKKKPKPIFMDVYTEWCGPCKILDKKTFHDEAFVNYINANYYAVKFNGEGNEELTYKGKKYTNPNYQEGRNGRNATHNFTVFLKVRGYPSMVIFDTNADVQDIIVGLLPPDTLLSNLKAK